MILLEGLLILVGILWYTMCGLCTSELYRTQGYRHNNASYIMTAMLWPVLLPLAPWLLS